MSSTKHTPLRPLLPATISDNAGHAGGTTREAPKPLPTTSSKRNVAAACEACRKTKLRCSGGRPKCRRCVERSIDCQYVTNSEETRSQALKRRYQDLVQQQHQVSLHEELFDLMRSMTRAEADGIVQRISSGDSIDAILKHVKDGNLLLQLQLVPEACSRYQLPYISAMPEALLCKENPYLGSLIYETSSMQLYNGSQQQTSTSVVTEYQSLYTKPYHTADLIEPRLELVKPSLWTFVSKDDVLMRSLLASYIKHDYQIFAIFHKDHFLDDMANQQYDCCSSLLVNAVLAYACHCSKLPDRYQYWNPINLGYRFLAEAKRLWEVQVNQGTHRTLPTVEGAMIINEICNLSGLDKIGDTYGLQGIAIGHEIGLFNGNAHIKPKRLQDARNFAAWAIFNLQSQLSWNFYRPPSIPLPPTAPLPDAAQNPGWFSDIWIKYPLDQTIFPSYFGLTFQETCTCRIIINEICQESFSQNQKLQSYSARSLVLRLLRWYSNLPEVLQPRRIVLPLHFVLHLDYQIVLLVLLQSFASEDWSPDPSPREILADAERSLHTLMRLYYLRHGSQASNGYLVSPLAKLAFASLQTIAASVNGNAQMQLQHLEIARSTLFLAVEWLYHQGCNFSLARSVYRIVMNQMLPEESRLLQRVFQPGGVDGEEIGAVNQKKIADVNAQWIPAIVSLSDNPEAQRLSELMAQHVGVRIKQG